MFLRINNSHKVFFFVSLVLCVMENNTNGSCLISTVLKDDYLEN